MFSDEIMRITYVQHISPLAVIWLPRMTNYFCLKFEGITRDVSRQGDDWKFRDATNSTVCYFLFIFRNSIHHSRILEFLQFPFININSINFFLMRRYITFGQITAIGQRLQRSTNASQSHAVHANGTPRRTDDESGNAATSKAGSWCRCNDEEPSKHARHGRNDEARFVVFTLTLWPNNWFRFLLIQIGHLGKLSCSVRGHR